MAKDERVLLVSRALTEATHNYFVPYWQARVETACFWFGLDVGEQQVATTLAVPQLRQSRGHYRVVAESLRRLAAEMRRQGLTNLAQVHTHPLGWVGHSKYDDEYAYSTRDGALSFVWPHYGVALRHDLVGLGVHEIQGGRWVQLDKAQMARRVRVVESVVDMRWAISTEDELDDA